ncbi:hypothetical protein AB0C65_15540 [Nocardia sp. NPDC048505]|uniref:hypothetical protein n=1 Tax=Nocardia sp. NPDC048505 TaxID=3155756 RepID=UPI00340A46E9
MPEHLSRVPPSDPMAVHGPFGVAADRATEGFPEEMSLSRLPFDFEWDESIRNTLLDDDDERDTGLADQLGMLRDEAIFGLAIAAAQWVVARVDGVAPAADVRDARQRIEAVWALCADLHYARLTDPPEFSGQAPPKAEEPLWVCRTLLFWIYGSAVSGEDLQGECMSLMLLARQVMGSHAGFSTWLSQAIEKAETQYALADDDPDDEDSQLIWKPVPPEFFRPAFTWTTQEAAQELVDAYLAGLDPATNPYLRDAHDMSTHGFEGKPYGR